MTDASSSSGSPPILSRRRLDRGITTIQILAIITLVLTLYFTIDISRRALIGYRLHRQTVELQAEIAALEREQERLRELRDFVQSEEYVSRLARQELKMVRPGERLYVVVIQTPESGQEAETREAAAAVAAGPAGAAAASSGRVSHLPQWWAVFFDSLPPGTGEGE